MGSFYTDRDETGQLIGVADFPSEFTQVDLEMIEVLTTQLNSLRRTLRP